MTERIRQAERALKDNPYSVILQLAVLLELAQEVTWSMCEYHRLGSEESHIRWRAVDRRFHDARADFEADLAAMERSAS